LIENGDFRESLFQNSELERFISMIHTSFIHRPKKITIEGRLLDKHQDAIYFKTAYTVKVVISVELPSLAMKSYRDNLIASFHQVVKTSPIMQTQVVACEGDNFKFTMLQPSKWPKLNVHQLNKASVDDSNEERQKVMAEAQAFGDDDMRHYLNNKDAAMTESCRVHAVVGTKRVAFSIVAPHHFCDGAALGIILVKLVCYSIAIRPVWPILDLLSPKKVPTFKEMTLQSNLMRRQVQQNKIGDERALLLSVPKHFQFTDYSMLDQGASKLLAGFTGVLAVVPFSAMTTVKANLRKENMSISTAFGALAIKILAHLLFNYAPELNQESLPLLLTLGVDGRKMNRGRRYGNILSFPVVANYAFDCFCYIPYLEALQSSLGKIGEHAQDVVKKLRCDPIFRAETILQKPLNDTYDCGVSSVVVSDALLCPTFSGVRDLMIDSTVEFGTIPRVWLYVVSVNGVNTTVSADIMLPIKGLDKTVVMEALSIASKDSPLEPLFAMPSE
jgi:hypothetical protein